MDDAFLNHFVPSSDLRLIYDELYQSALKQVKSDNFTLDQKIDDPLDNRYGLTLLIRPSAPVKARIQPVIAAFKALDSSQFYYLDSEIHVTILSIVSCEADFDLSKINLPDYLDILKASLKDSDPFALSFRGLTASPSVIMVQGFTQNNALELIRDRLRKAFKSSGLYSTIDKRYPIKTAHSSIIRFRKAPTQKLAFLKLLEKYRF
ncbi:MAG: mutarotase, partial [Bacteroidota bacterium]